MARTRPALIAGAVGGVAILVVLSYFFFLGSTFDYSKTVVLPNSSNKEELTDDVVRKLVDAAISDPTTKVFLARFDNPDLKAYVSYLTAAEVDKIKTLDNGELNAEFAFLPDAAVMQVSFDSETGGAVPEHPMLSVFVTPQTYKVLGSAKAFW